MNKQEWRKRFLENIFNGSKEEFKVKRMSLSDNDPILKALADLKQMIESIR